MVAEDAVFTYDRVSMGKKVASGLDPWVEYDVGKEGCGWAETNKMPNHDIGANVCAIADDGGWIDDGCGVDAGTVDRRLVESSQRPGEGEVGIGDTERCGLNVLKGRLNQHCGGLRLSRQGSVAGIGNEGHLGGAGVLNPFDACHFQACVAAQLRTQQLCQFA